MRCRAGYIRAEHELLAIDDTKVLGNVAVPEHVEPRHREDVEIAQARVGLLILMPAIVEEAPPRDLYLLAGFKLTSRPNFDMGACNRAGISGANRRTNRNETSQGPQDQ